MWLLRTGAPNRAVVTDVDEKYSGQVQTGAPSMTVVTDVGKCLPTLSWELRRCAGSLVVVFPPQRLRDKCSVSCTLI